MNSLLKPHLNRARIVKQRGVVLFFTLIALLAMSLAAVALIRSVDTGTMIAGNLAFKQSATSSGNAGTEASIAWLEWVDANPANINLNVLNNPNHPFNVTCLAARPAGTANPTDPGCAAVISGYHSNIDPALNLTADATWNDVNNALSGIDGSGNTVRYIIQRTCRNANVTIQNADCLFSGAIQDNNEHNIPLSEDICEGAGCPFAGQSPQTRITARITGPKNTVSYVQAFVY